MFYNSLSSYPDKVDEQVYFCDADIDNIDTIEEYNRLINLNQFDKANTFFTQKETLHGYSASLFNTIENRIDTLQDYLLKKVKINPILSSDTEPENPVENMIWIETE